MSRTDIFTRLCKCVPMLGLGCIHCGGNLPAGPSVWQPHAGPTHSQQAPQVAQTQSANGSQSDLPTRDASIEPIGLCPEPTYGATAGGWVLNASLGVCCGYLERARLNAPGFEKSGLSQCLQLLAPGLEKRLCLTDMTAQSDPTRPVPESTDSTALAQFAFEEGRAELTMEARAELDRVHAAYVNGTCGYVMIAAYAVPRELRRNTGKSLARERAAAIQTYLLRAGVPQQNARDFGRDDFLDDATRARVSRTTASGIAFCPGPRDAQLPVQGQCRHACDEQCTSGATLRAQVPDVNARQLTVLVCLRDACSTAKIDLASLAAGVSSALVMRMHGPLPAAVYVLHEPGFRLPELAWGERIRGFFLEARAGIGLPDLADGDTYTMRLTVDGQERPDLSFTRQARYRDWFPCLNPTHACKDASFPARWRWPWGSLVPIETEF